MCIRDRGHTCQVETYGYKSTNNLVAENVELKKEHGALGVKYHVSGLLDFDVEVNVPGKFSVYNSLTAIAICHHFNVDKKAIGEALHHVSVKGRIEIVPVTKRYTLMIDYAHNAMALESLLTTLKEYEPGRLVCLFGCGGNRAKSRRYETVSYTHLKVMGDKVDTVSELEKQVGTTKTFAVISTVLAIINTFGFVVIALYILCLLYTSRCV